MSTGSQTLPVRLMSIGIFMIGEQGQLTCSRFVQNDRHMRVQLER